MLSPARRGGDDFGVATPSRGRVQVRKIGRRSRDGIGGLSVDATRRWAMGARSGAWVWRVMVFFVGFYARVGFGGDFAR